jgi:hypothetical protein
MRLDQSFYKDKQEEKEVIYFKKFHKLHNKISEVLGEKVENGQKCILQPEDLIKIRDYLAADGIDDYYPIILSDDGEEDNDDDLPNNFLMAIGILSRHIALNKPLYYNGSW